MSDLTTFLLARIAEDEAVARLATSDEPRWRSKQKDGTLRIDTGMESMGWEFGGGSGMWGCDDPEDDCDAYRGHAFTEADHIARHAPARVLAECEAKRRIVEVLTHVAAQCPVDQWNPSDTALIEVLGVMAEVYADHPDFQDDWKP